LELHVLQLLVHCCHEQHDHEKAEALMLQMTPQMPQLTRPMMKQEILQLRGPEQVEEEERPLQREGDLMQMLLLPLVLQPFQPQAAVERLPFAPLLRVVE
jgi:hypothetical protein